MLLCGEEYLREVADDGSADGSLAQAAARAGYSGGEAGLNAISSPRAPHPLCVALS
jgi:hypothetical protein